MKKLCFIPFFDFQCDGDIINISFLQDYNTKQQFYRCEAKTEAFVLALIASKLGILELDDGYLSGECNVCEEEIDEIDFTQITSLILGEHLKIYEDFSIILELSMLICQKLNINLFMQNQPIKINQNINLSQLENNIKSLQSKSYDGLYVYACLDNNELICSKQFHLISNIKNLSNINNHQIIICEKLQGNIALVGSKLLGKYELIAFNDFKNRK